MESGYVTLECNELCLALRKMPAKELTLRLDAEFVNGFSVFKWTTGDAKYASSKFTPVLQSSEASADENATFSFINGFDDLTLRSTYLDLNPEVMSGMVNASLKVSILQINDVVEAAPAKAAKGAPPPAATPSEEALLTVTIPLSSLMLASGGVITLAGPYEGSSYHANVEGSLSSLNFNFAADNHLAEYVMGSCVLNWSAGSLLNAPASWGLHYADVIDPKAKVPATADELRKKYLENISKLVEMQEKVATFSLTIGGENTASTEEESNNADRNIVQQLIPKQSLRNGIIAFDKESAAAIPSNEDIRVMHELWSISWGVSSFMFLHRSDIRRLVSLLNKDPTNGVIPLTIKKTPSNEYVAAEGGELFATALVDISSILSPDTKSWNIEVPVTGTDFTEEVPFKLTVSLASSNAIVPKPALLALSDKLLADVFNSAPALRVPKTVSTVENNKSALEILRTDITKAIERIAQEFVALYPISDDNRNVTEEGNATKSTEGKKIEFLNYLMANGIFNELKEHMKTSVELIIREQYGDRGRSINAGNTISNETTFDATMDNGAKLEAILSELYVFLMKECSVVLNSLFSDTLIDRQKSELETSAQIRDEEETLTQHLARLSNQADDCAADLQFDASEQLHLECIHYVSHNAKLGSNLKVVHEIYSRYGEFLLSYYCFMVKKGSSVVTTDFLNAIIQRARDALYSAVCSNTTNWRIGLLYVGVLVEVNQVEQAEEFMHQVISCQLTEGKYTLTTFTEFDGYETDKLCPIDPRCYSVLAAMFSIQGNVLKTRKALRLANRSFVEGGFTPPISTHGSPRRTIVLTLADTAIHLFTNGLTKLGDMCLILAQQSEKDVTEKAFARGKVATTVPHIKHLLRRAEAMSIVLQKPSEPITSAEEKAMESVLCADDPEDQLNGWLCVAATLQNSQDASKLIEAYLSAVDRLNDIMVPFAKNDRNEIFPLGSFIQLGKLLVNSGRWKEASFVLLYACNLYSSAGLYLLLGVCYLRLEQYIEAEEAFMASSTLNNKSPELWAYFCLLNLSVGNTRHQEAEKCMLQSLRLGLSDVVLLREMATSYIAIDKLQLAEDLIRRALLNDKRSAAYTRRLLGDVLAGQNQALRAIEEYTAVLSDDSGDVDDALKMETAEKCANLLISIGRDDEVKSLRNIMASFAQQ